MTTEPTTLAAATTDLERLRDSVRSPVIDPDDEGYDPARSGTVRSTVPLG